VGAFWPKPPEAPGEPESPVAPVLGDELLLLGVELLLLGVELLLLDGSLDGVLLLVAGSAAKATAAKPMSIMVMAAFNVAFLKIRGFRIGYLQLSDVKNQNDFFKIDASFQIRNHRSLLLFLVIK
jgi:hypothetical protein